jgi:hypothetical protein
VPVRRMAAACTTVCRLYNTVVDLSFRKCVHSFRSSELSEEEKKCVSDQTARILRATQRVKVRIAEIQDKKQAELQQRLKDASKTSVSLPSY